MRTPQSWGNKLAFGPMVDVTLWVSSVWSVAMSKWGGGCVLIKVAKCVVSVGDLSVHKTEWFWQVLLSEGKRIQFGDR